LDAEAVDNGAKLTAPECIRKRLVFGDTWHRDIAT